MDAPDPKQVVRVSIFNQNYTLTSSGNAKETESLAQQIDELMSSIARRAGNLDSTRTAVLACLHLADKLRAAEAELEVLKESIEVKTRSFSLLLDEAIRDTDE
jgi:cell division protein ZapA